MIHQPSGGAQGQASDIEIQAQEILRLKKMLNKAYEKHTKTSLSEIEKAMDRDNFMSPKDAKSFGLIDFIVSSRNDIKIKEYWSYKMVDERDINLNDALNFHKKKKSKLTLVVRQDTNIGKYESIQRVEEGRIVHFLGKSIKNSEPVTQVMFTGIQIMEPDIFSRIPEDKFCGTTEDIFPEMIQDELPVYGFLHDGYWIDMGTRETYIQAQADALDGKLSLKTSSSRNPEGPLVVPPVHIGKSCEISQDAQVGPYAVLGDGCRVRSGAVVENSILWAGVTVGNNSSVKNSIVGEGVAIDSENNVKDSSMSSN
jgi:NDP-sugar pyrophosphorylase family protein